MINHSAKVIEKKFHALFVHAMKGFIFQDEIPLDGAAVELLWPLFWYISRRDCGLSWHHYEDHGMGKTDNKDHDNKLPSRLSLWTQEEPLVWEVGAKSKVFFHPAHFKVLRWKMYCIKSTFLSPVTSILLQLASIVKTNGLNCWLWR